MSMRAACAIFLAVVLPLVVSCRQATGSRERSLKEAMDLKIFSMLGTLCFDSVSLEDLRSIHLSGAGLLNKDVLAAGVIESVSREGTFLVLTDHGARMLVDTTRVSATRDLSGLQLSKSIVVHGEVKSGEKGHIYLVANAIHGT
jgi:hypothetical protein